MATEEELLETELLDTVYTGLKEEELLLVCTVAVLELELFEDEELSLLLESCGMLDAELMKLLGDDDDVLEDACFMGVVWSEEVVPQP